STGASRSASRRPLSVKGMSVVLVCCPLRLHAVSPCLIAKTSTWRCSLLEHRVAGRTGRGGRGGVARQLPSRGEPMQARAFLWFRILSDWAAAAVRSDEGSIQRRRKHCTVAGFELQCCE